MTPIILSLILLTSISATKTAFQNSQPTQTGKTSHAATSSSHSSSDIIDFDPLTSPSRQISVRGDYVIVPGPNGTTDTHAEYLLSESNTCSSLLQAQQRLVDATLAAKSASEIGKLEQLTNTAHHATQVAHAAEQQRQAGIAALLATARVSHDQLGSAIRVLEKALQIDSASLEEANEQENSEEEEEKVYADTHAQAALHPEQTPLVASSTTNPNPDWNRILNNCAKTAGVGFALGCMTGGGSAIVERCLIANRLNPHEAMGICFHTEPLFRLAYHALLYNTAEKYQIPYPELQLPAAWIGSWAMYLLLKSNNKA